MNNMVLMPALLLDLDGTVRITASGEKFPKNIEDQQLRPGIEEILWTYRDNEWLIFGVSNQGGVAHGFKTQNDVDQETDITMRKFQKNPFVYIFHAFCDENGKIAPYNVRSLMRKPQIGMLALIEQQMWKEGVAVNWDKSIFVGDRPEDEKCAKNAAIHFCHIEEFMKLQHPLRILSPSEIPAL
jgi:D-glycero-D-manno-heptose 1,7-bisphosphate phosphatase